MVIHELDKAPPPELQRMLGEFEASFTLGFAPGRRFRIDYGSDRTAFIRSMGEGRCVVAEREGKVVGLIELASVSLLHPDGSERPAIYVADIKLAPQARRTLVAGRLLQKAAAWGRMRADLFFSFALDGIPLRPPDYTGRAGIAAMMECGRVMVVRLEVPAGAALRPGDREYLSADGGAIFRGLARGRYALPGGESAARSAAQPVWLAHPDGSACARFEDRRKVRRLIADDGTELRPAYLSCFAFSDAKAGLELIGVALRRAGVLGFRALRICPAKADAEALRRAGGGGEIQGVVGSVFATQGAAAGADWILNASAV